MTRGDLAALLQPDSKFTRPIARALVEALLNVLDRAESESPAPSEGQGHQFIFGRKTMARMIVAAVDETPLA